MINKMEKITFIIVIILSLVSCNADKIDDYGDTGSKNYTDVSEKIRLVYDNSINVDNVDLIHTITADDESYYVAGISNPVYDKIEYEILNVNSGEVLSYKPDFFVGYIIDMIVVDDKCILVYCGEDDNTYICVTDTNGHQQNKLRLDKTISVISVSGMEDSIGVFVNNGKEDLLMIYDYQFSKISEIILTGEDGEKVLNAFCDRKGNYTIQTISDEENIYENIKISRYSHENKLIYTLQEFSDMPGYIPLMLENSSEDVIIVGSVEKNDDGMNDVYINTFDANTGQIISRYEFKENGSISLYPANQNKSILCCTSSDIKMYDMQNNCSNNIYSFDENFDYDVLGGDFENLVIEKKRYANDKVVINRYDKSLSLTEEFVYENNEIFDVKKIISASDSFYGLVGVSEGFVTSSQNYKICEFDKTTSEYMIYDFFDTSGVYIKDIVIYNEKLIVLSFSGDGRYFIQDINISDKTVSEQVFIEEDENNDISYTDIYSDDIGDVFLFGESNTEKCIYDVSSKKKYVLSQNNDIIKSDFSVYKEDMSLITIDMKKHEYTTIFPQEPTDEVYSVSSDEFICVLSDISSLEGDIAIFKPSKSEIKENIIICGININYESLNNAVRIYNQSHDDEMVTLLQVDENTDVNALMRDGKCDIVVSNNEFDIYKYDISDIAEDILLYMENDKTFNKENYLDNIFERQIVNGAMYSVFSEFALEVIAGIDIDDGFDEYVENKNTKEFICNTTCSEFASEMIIRNIDMYIDFNTSEVNFNNDNLIKCLKYLKENFKEKTAEKDICTVEKNILYSIENFCSVDPESMILSGLKSGEYISSIKPEYSMMISKNSKNKNEAWEFIKVALSEKCQSQSECFPVYDLLYENNKSKENFEDLYMNSDFNMYMDSNITKIIKEELERYFSDSYLVEDDLIDILNNRIKLYLNEKE